MNVILMRASAFLVGSLIAGCVYAENGSSSSAAGAPMPIPTYPASHATVGDPNGDGADLILHLPAMQLHIWAKRFTTRSSPAALVAYYRVHLAKFGHVVEKAGGPNSNIESFHWVRGPGQTTLSADHYIVAIAPKAGGSEYALMDIEPRTDAGH